VVVEHSRSIEDVPPVAGSERELLAGLLPDNRPPHPDRQLLIVVLILEAVDLLLQVFS